MSNLINNIIVNHQDTSSTFAVTETRDSNDAGFQNEISEVTALDGEQTVDFSKFSTPREVLMRLTGGADVEVGVASGVYPMRLSGVNDWLKLRMDVEGLREITEITAEADTNGSLAGDHFSVFDQNGEVQVWFDVAARAEVSSVVAVADVVDSLDGTYFLIYDNAGSVEVWFNTTGGSATAPGVGARAIEVNISTGASATTVAAALRTALDDDSEFSASIDGSTVTITDAQTGTRTDIADVDTTMTVAVVTQGLAASSEPAAPGGGRNLQVDLTGDATADEVAAAIQVALDADDQFIAVAVTDTVTITDQHIGARTNADNGNTGWSTAPNITQGGAAGPSVYYLSTGTSQLQIVVIPD